MSKSKTKAKASTIETSPESDPNISAKKSKKAKKVAPPPAPRDLKREVYNAELRIWQYELVKFQEWVKQNGLRVVVIFEGRDASGKGGVIKAFTEALNPRGLRVVALPKPSDVERSQWYFQRYVAHLPTAGEIVVFDRSWYNRAGVERVMGFCDEAEYWDFMEACPNFERMLTKSGILLVKYWLSVSDAEQEARFQARAVDPTKLWKLTAIDLAAREKNAEYAQAQELMFIHTDIPEAPWYGVLADFKRRARLNIIRHFLSLFPYEDLVPKEFILPERPPIDPSAPLPLPAQVIADAYDETSINAETVPTA